MQMSTIQARQFLVTGTVQGVCFRASTRERALVLGLRGHARNLIDGRVEVVAVGPADALAALGEWLQHGPPHARVERVDARVIAGDGLVEGFSIG